MTAFLMFLNSIMAGTTSVLAFSNSYFGVGIILLLCSAGLAGGATYLMGRSFNEKRK